MKLLPGDFLQDIWQNNFTVVYAGIGFRVKHNRDKPWEDSVVRMNTFTGCRWDAFVDKSRIVPGQKIVFIDIGN